MTAKKIGKGRKTNQAPVNIPIIPAAYISFAADKTKRIRRISKVLYISGVLYSFIFCELKTKFKK